MYLKIVEMIEQHKMGAVFKNVSIYNCPGKITNFIIGVQTTDPIIRKFGNTLDMHTYKKYPYSQYTYQYLQDKGCYDLIVSNISLDSQFKVKYLHMSEVIVPNIKFINCAFKYPKIEDRSNIFVDCYWSKP